MLAKTSLCNTADPSIMFQHLGILADHPQLVQARLDFEKTEKCSIVLLSDQGESAPLHVVRLVDMRRDGFSDTPAHAALVTQLTRSASKSVLDREIFTSALHNLLVRHSVAFQAESTMPPQGEFQDSCFQLLFDYAPGTFCIAAIETRPADRPNVQIAYSKFFLADQIPAKYRVQ